MDPRVEPEDDEVERPYKTPTPVIGGNAHAIVILGLDPRIHA
ncbi:hypothetical protein [Chelativorans sp. AA-79]|nr:hypothetical protein [Chelativorans sp. AA-79]WEX07544.1 hypothetical protein PVE73_15645 [Chelativorans sp. AA-79]